MQEGAGYRHRALNYQGACVLQGKEGEAAMKLIATFLIMLWPAIVFAQSTPAVSIEDFKRAVDGALAKHKGALAGQQLRLKEVEGKAKEAGAQLAEIRSDLSALRSVGERVDGFEKKIRELEDELAKIRKSRAGTAAKFKKLEKLATRTAQLAVKLSKTIAEHKKRIGEAEERLKQHDKQLSDHEERIEKRETQAASHAVSLEAAVFAGSKDGAGGGFAAGLSFGLGSGRTVHIRAGLTSSSNHSAFGQLLTAAILFPWEDGWKISAGAYSLTDFYQLGSGYHAKRWGFGTTMGLAYHGEMVTASLTGGLGPSIAFGEESEKSFAALGLATFGVRL